MALQKFLHVLVVHIIKAFTTNMTCQSQDLGDSVGCWSSEPLELGHTFWPQLPPRPINNVWFYVSQGLLDDIKAVSNGVALPQLHDSLCLILHASNNVLQTLFGVMHLKGTINPLIHRLD